MVGKRYPAGGAVVALALILLAWAPRPALANGWEHGAVPFETLIEALSFESPAIREQAAHSLGFRGQPEAILPLLDRLAVPEPDGGVRQALYVALGQLGATEALPRLAICLTEESSAPIRAHCVEALGSLGSARALEIVLDTLGRTTDALVRDHAVEALGRFDDERAVVALMGLLRADADPVLRGRALLALGRTGSDAAVAPVLNAFETAAGDAERFVALRALAELRAPAATEALSAALDRTGDPRLRAAIAVALGASRDGEAAGTLLALLEDPVPAVRYVAVDGLQSLGVTSAAPALAALAQREAAALAGRSADALAADRLRTVATLSLQVRALRAAVALDASKATAALLEAAEPLAMARDSTAGVEIAAAIYQRRRIALYGLGYASGSAREAARDLLLGPGGIGERDARLRAVAVRSLGVLDAPGAEDRIRPLLGGDPSADVRMMAARVLGLLHDHASAPALLSALDDAHALVRKEAALALGYLREPAARAALETLAADDRSGAVREAAAYALTLLPATGEP
ncbi:MAG: HEAT repeat domain-containing protein [Rhodospirillales bacterium]|nr:HEAT repeat domain-containing protein [Rhodospirillales bacterium]